MSEETRRNSTSVVWVFGGGITGLSVAHECIERGYEVYLVEPAEDSWDDDLPAVGGLARTQWAYIPTGETEREARERADARKAGEARAAEEAKQAGKPKPTPPEDEGRIARALPFVRHPSFEFTVEEIAKVSPTSTEAVPQLWEPIVAELTGFVRRVGEATRGAGYQALSVVLLGPMKHSDLADTAGAAASIRKDAEDVRDEIKRRLNVAIGEERQLRGKDAAEDAYARWADATREEDILWVETLETFRVEVRVKGRGVVPGEHGFRYFPGFYRHLFDTMRRTPILQPGVDRFGPAVRTVFDNLVSTEATWLAVSTDKDGDDKEAAPAPKAAPSGRDEGEDEPREDDDDDAPEPIAASGDGKATRQRLVSFPRRPPRSIQQTLKLLESFVRELGYSAQDVSRISTKLFQYMTSSTERRAAEFEDLTWWDFIEGERFTKTCRRHMELGPEVLGAMTASESETRTQGNCVTQLLIDQLAGRTITDATLNGPTSVAWFDPWRDYLIYRGVKFLRGSLVGFQPPSDVAELHMADVLLPTVLIDGQPMPLENFDTELRSHYFVVATPLTAMLDVPEFNLRRSDQTLQGTAPPLVPDTRVEDAKDDEGFGLARKFERAMEGVRERVAKREALLKESVALASTPTLKPEQIQQQERVLKALRSSSDIAALIEWQSEIAKAKTPRDVGLGPLRHLTGVQYLFDNNIQFGQEHTLYMDAPWRLSSISQAHFWRRRPTGVYGYRGIVSVDIGALHREADVTIPSTMPGYAPSTTASLKGWKCTADQIAHTVWEQVRESIAVDTQGLRRVTSEAASDGSVGGNLGKMPLGFGKRSPPRFGTRGAKPKGASGEAALDVLVGGARNLLPSCYHLDESIIFFRDLGDGQGIAKNLSPYLINRPGEWKLRPGRIDPQDQAKGYAMQNGRWVLAGTYMKTFTRLTTMEAANESARHAVNAILRVSGAPGDRCKIWNPEEMELPDFVDLREIDRQLFVDGYPHLVEILGIDAIPEALLPRQLDLDEEPNGHRRPD